MKKFNLILLMSLMSLLAMAQADELCEVNGFVSDDANAILPGVIVTSKLHSSKPTVSNLDGSYAIVVQKGDVLIFSYLGFENKEIIVRSSERVDVVMRKLTTELNEVVVTSLNISREKKALGYAVQVVDDDKLVTRPTNVMSAVSGRVSGLSVITSGGNMGGSSNILMRGVNSIASNNQALFVIDGVPFDNTDMNTELAISGRGGKDIGSMLQDLNPDDIAEINFLKGAASAALYGSRAANGVVLITTKKGKSQDNRLHIEVNTGLDFEKIVRLPKRQKEYGGGYSLDFGTVTIGGKEYKTVDYAANESWGPRLDGTLVLHWNNLDPEFASDFLNPQPWVYPKHDATTYYRTGITNTNNISFSKQNNKSDLRISYTNKSVRGTSPNASLKRNTLNVAGSIKEGIFTAFSNVSYVNTRSLGRPWTGSSFQGFYLNAYHWGQVQVDFDDLRQYKRADGTPRSWNRTSWEDTPEGRATLYVENPFWAAYESYMEEQRDRVFGNVGFNLAPTSWLTFTGRINADVYQFDYQDRTAYYSQEQSFYREYSHGFNELNYELLASTKHRWADHSLETNLGTNYMKRHRRISDMQTAGGLLIPNYYSLNNAAAISISPASGVYRKAISSVYARASYGLRSMFYFDATLRNDWSSTLPVNNNSYLYPSFTTSFILSELDLLERAKWISFAKVRLGWAQVGNDTDPYQLYTTYKAMPAFGQVTGYSLPDMLNNPDLKPEITSSWETGFKINFLNNRIGLDFTYYNNLSRNQIIPLSTSSAMGYGSKLVNAGEITNKGVEISLTVNPIKRKDLDWRMSLNFAKNANKLIKLSDDVKVLSLSDDMFSLVAKEGNAFGQLMGHDFVYTPDGKKVIDERGLYMATEQVVPLGSVIPNSLWGLENTIRYKNVNFGFLIDSRLGGHFASRTYQIGMYAGVLAETAANNIREDGVLLDGVRGDVTFNPDGSYTVSNVRPNDVRADAQEWARSHFIGGPTTLAVFDAAYVKLRELTLGYTFSFPHYKINELVVTAYARNVWNIYTKSEGIDPELTSGSGNIQGIEGGNTPIPLNYGINLNIKF